MEEKQLYLELLKEMNALRSENHLLKQRLLDLENHAKDVERYLQDVEARLNQAEEKLKDKFGF